MSLTILSPVITFCPTLSNLALWYIVFVPYIFKNGHFFTMTTFRNRSFSWKIFFSEKKNEDF
jgi:hypothetical protein